MGDEGRYDEEAIGGGEGEEEEDEPVDDEGEAADGDRNGNHAAAVSYYISRIQAHAQS